MADRDSRLGGASSLGLPANRTDKLGSKDLDDLFQINLAKKSKLELGVSSIKRGANIDVEIYSLNVPLSQIPNKARTTDFRKLKGGDRNKYLTLVSASRAGGNANESLTLSEAAAGNYLVRLLQRKGNSGYRLAINATELSDTPTPTPIPTPTPTPVPDSAAGNSFEQAIASSAPSTVTGNLTDADKEDYYAITPTTAGDYLIDLSGLSADANLAIYDANRTLIRASANAGTASERFIQPFAAGTYYFKVSQAAVGGATGYSLSTTALVDKYAGKFADGLNTATAVDLTSPQQLSNYVVEGGISSPEDLFSFNVTTSQAFLTLELVNMPIGDLGVQLFKSNETPADGLTVNSNRNPDGSYPSEVFGGRVTQGTYYIRIIPGSTITPGSSIEGSTYNLSLSLSNKPGVPIITRDIRYGIGGSNPSNITAVGNLVYFSARDEAGTALWRTDGTLDGTKKISAFSSISPERFAVVGSGNSTNLYFVADDGATGSELWTTDGTTARKVVDLQGGSGSASSSPKQLTAVGDRLYFTAKTGDTSTNLYRTTNASGTGIELVARSSSLVLNPDGTPSAGAVPTISSLNLTEMVADGNTLYFTGDQQFDQAPSSGNELFRIVNNGSVELTDLVTGTGSSSLANLTLIDHKLFATGYVGGSFQASILRIDGFGATPGAAIIKQGSGDPQSSSTLRAPSGKLQYTVTTSGNAYTLYFAAASSNEGNEVFKLANATTVPGAGGGSITTIDSAQLVSDIKSGVGVGSDPTSLVSIGSNIYFFANNGSDVGEAGKELWKSNGTTASLVQDIDGSTSSSIADGASLVVYQNKLYFAADNAVDGRELWSYDPAGTGANAIPVQIQINTQNAGSADPTQLTVVGNNSLYFAATDGASGSELWSI
jgi:ELWxxDGT repeat protein